MSELPLGLIGFNDLITDLHSMLECVLIMNDRKSGGVVAMVKV